MLRTATPFNFCIIDEVDSILIDEARTPLIISGQADAPSDKYYKSTKIAEALTRDRHYTVNEKERNVQLTEEGYQAVEEVLEITDLYDPRTQWASYILNAIRVSVVYQGCSASCPSRQPCCWRHHALTHCQSGCRSGCSLRVPGVVAPQRSKFCVIRFGCQHTACLCIYCLQCGMAWSLRSNFCMLGQACHMHRLNPVLNRHVRHTIACAAI